mmetsp:Transcript_11920/g.27481  ORF Transcript_11920/g.27481 Transcript_11920/m.27481 type:complete len:223 (+) Transcript_11920:205-873(+)
MSRNLSVEKSVPCGFSPSFTFAPWSHCTHRSNFHSRPSIASRWKVSSSRFVTPLTSPSIWSMTIPRTRGCAVRACSFCSDFRRASLMYFRRPSLADCSMSFCSWMSPLTFWTRSSTICRSSALSCSWRRLCSSIPTRSSCVSCVAKVSRPAKRFSLSAASPRMVAALTWSCERRSSSAALASSLNASWRAFSSDARCSSCSLPCSCAVSAASLEEARSSARP